MKLVRFENANGAEILINPNFVTAVSIVPNDVRQVYVWLSGNNEGVDVLGTREEVLTKLDVIEG